MAKSQNKTAETDADVSAFLDSIADSRRADETRQVVALMAEITGEPPKMWGKTIIGFGSYHYKYDSGREGDNFLTGLSPRKQALTIYVMPGFSEYEGLLDRLGPHTTGKSCLYIKKLDKVDQDVLRELIERGYTWMKATYPS